jgi:endonuclease-8
MPEGDVVWRTARQLHEALAGRVLTRSDFRVPRYATTDLTGRLVTEAVSRGKHLLIRVDGDVTVHTHLKMEGSWRIGPATSYPRRDHRIRLVLANKEWQAVGQQLGIVEVIRTSRESGAVGHLGPDLLGPDWDAAEAVRRIRADPARAIGEALLDQRNLAGIGNLYKSETLFLRGVSPWRPVGAVGEAGAACEAGAAGAAGEAGALAEMVEVARRLLDANKDRVGQVTTGSTLRGQQTWVYGRAGRPCQRCGTAIRRADQGPVLEERITFWCPRCQPG